MKSILFLSFILFQTSVYCTSIEVIALTGKVYGQTESNGEIKFTNLTYGPLENIQKIIVKENSEVTMVNEDNYICRLRSGEYVVSNLKFLESEEGTLFNKCCAYFKSFFKSHSSSESKKYYVNNIYAISRGSEQIPELDFPFAGVISMDFNSLSFYWTHNCDTCEYLFTINDLDSKKIVYSQMLKSKELTIYNPQKYLQYQHDYYWSVKLAGLDLDYNVTIFHISAKNVLNNHIESVKSELENLSLPQSNMLQFVYVLSRLEEDSGQNDAILYGLNARLKSELGDDEISLFENFMYDHISSQDKP
ncbi:MAG TPA: hypothetical protein P5235_02700 [Saprospiraceae bacterium]|nr:hypothetical protein [Saprospiraceae bacterium]MCB9327730.1 hypothetical protein [Lewinellaceae bacterium]HPK08705.1 hypothetical protein [Saprospiraceae bacterium]HRX28265.1 hypothetical protein [Saprospiraceae bacterium]